ncbi:vesicle-associated protein 2-2 [Lactuca sativa]|uniref:vesicle-associated protein 2-2 n=1 Tax=Lactuca sativa TaxID=4236 RepID=UPI000CBFEA51|nr:vesicle-associated protein 2-2 [Lactuca sativa]
MAEEFGEIYPSELTFIFEPKKHMSCMIKLTSNSNRYIAFKVKTTDPKLYRVRPNKGILKPDSTCEIEVTRQACTILPATDTIVKQKLLIQRVFASEDTTHENIDSLFSSKDSHNDINMKKLKVVITDVIPKVVEMKSKSEEQDLTADMAKEIAHMKLHIKGLNILLTKAEETISKLKEQKSDCGCKGKKRRHCWYIKCFDVKLA